MSERKAFYITSPIFYPNANLHMGHAYTMTVCDVLARYHREILGEEVAFVTGADENTAKILTSGPDAHEDVSKMLDTAEANFKQLYQDLGISYTEFIRTTDRERHWPGAIKLWNKLREAGKIYKGKYTGLYCLNCETFYTEKELIDGKCPIHGTIPQTIEEDNYFFKLSDYTKEIKQKIESGELEIIPQTRKNEILALLDRGLDDVSFSRPKSVVPHGIPVPGDDNQVMYVWCDALTSYMTAIGYGRDEESFAKWWPASVHVIGKDILRFHAAIWPAMLLAAGLSLPKKLLVHGLITSGGQKMSKSIGNVINPYDLINEFGAEAVRYYLAAKISTFEDGDLTAQSFKDIYNGDLANGLGNLVSRLMKMATTYGVTLSRPDQDLKPREGHLESLPQGLDEFNLKHAIDLIWLSIKGVDLSIQNSEPYKLIKTDPEKAKSIIKELLADLYYIAYRLQPFMPKTAEEIISSIKENRMPTQLFPRKD